MKIPTSFWAVMLAMAVSGVPLLAGPSCESFASLEPGTKTTLAKSVPAGTFAPLASLLAAHGPGPVQYHPDPVIDFYRKALTYDRSDPRIQYALCMALTTKAELTGRLYTLASALVSFRQMLQLNPDLAESAMVRNNIVKIEGLLDEWR